MPPSEFLFWSHRDHHPAIARPSGRAVDELRPFSLERGFTRYAEGSVLVKAGNTHVLCTASVLEKVPPFLKGKGEGWVTAEYGMLPRATHTRGDREAARGKQSGRTQEIQRLIGRSLRAVFDMRALGERTLHLDCDVLQADGGTRCASITGAWVAASDAIALLMKRGDLAASPIRDAVAAVSVGLVQGRPVLDLDYEEDSACDADVNVIMTGGGAFVEVQGTGEGATFTRAELDRMLELAEGGIAGLVRAQRLRWPADSILRGLARCDAGPHGPSPFRAGPPRLLQPSSGPRVCAFPGPTPCRSARAVRFLWRHRRSVPGAASCPRSRRGTACCRDLPLARPRGCATGGRRGYGP